MMGADRQSKVELMLNQSLKELLWIQKQMSLIANVSNGPVETKVKVTVDCHTLYIQNAGNTLSYTHKAL
ncbi:RIMS-binding protein 2 isoform X1 [Tachysurus ichikawai]